MAVVLTFVNMGVEQSQWYAINFNLRLLMLGQYDPTAEWRVTIVVLLFAFTIGVALAAWTRLQLALAVVLAVLIAPDLYHPRAGYCDVAAASILCRSRYKIKIGGDLGQAPQAQVAFLDVPMKRSRCA